MVVTDTAFLRIRDNHGATADFEFSAGLEITTQIEKSMIMSNRGQYVREALDHIANDEPVDALSERKLGYTIDGGAGTVQHTVQFLTGEEGTNLSWGDGTSGKTDASGANIDSVTRKDVFEYWIQKARTDSFGQCEFHYGEYTNNTFGNGTGKFGEPMHVAILDSQLETPDPDSGDQVSVSGTLTLQRVALFPDEISRIEDSVQDAAERILTQLTGVQEA